MRQSSPGNTVLLSVNATSGTMKASAGVSAQELRRALESAAETDDEIAARFVTLELERLAGMERRVQQIMRQAVADRDGGLALRAVDRLLAVSERRSRLLALDADRSTRNPAGPAPGDGDDADDLAKRRRARRSQARLLAAQRQG